MSNLTDKAADRPLRSRREIVLGSLFLTAAGVTAARMPDRPLNYLGDNKLEKVVPEKIGRWNFVSSSGLVLPTEDQLVLTLYSQQLTRVYWDKLGAPIMLLIAAGNNQTGFLQVHRPEFCYTAAGYQLGEASPQPIPLQDGRKIVVNKLLATRDGQSEWMLYWTRVGTRIPDSWAQQRLAVATDNLQKIIPDAILIRVSAIMPDGEEAALMLAEFVEAMIASITPPLRRAFTA
ncbi:MAG: exosortase-associated protein EpsI, V-type [Sphingomicrobium sp.]